MELYFGDGRNQDGSSGRDNGKRHSNESRKFRDRAAEVQPHIRHV